MNYHNIKHEDMNNGTGLRVTLFVSGCNNYCEGCQNPQTWDPNSGIVFDENALREIINELDKPEVEGLTLTGGDPFYHSNVNTIYNILDYVKNTHPDKNIWIYTGSKWEDICEKHRLILNLVDVLVDGKFEKDKADVNYHWAGSTNQRVIDVQKSYKENKVVLYKD